MFRILIRYIRGNYSPTFSLFLPRFFSAKNREPSFLLGFWILTYFSPVGQNIFPCVYPHISHPFSSSNSRKSQNWRITTFGWKMRMELWFEWSANFQEPPRQPPPSHVTRYRPITVQGSYHVVYGFKWVICRVILWGGNGQISVQNFWSSERTNYPEFDSFGKKIIGIDLRQKILKFQLTTKYLNRKWIKYLKW